jgi:hypothetical protein
MLGSSDAARETVLASGGAAALVKFLQVWQPYGL